MNGIFNAVKNLFTELGETIGKSSFNWGEVGNSIINSVNGINGDIGKLIDPNWIGTTLGEALKASGLGETIESAGSSIAKCGATIIGMIILFFVLILLGVFMGFAVLSIQVRYNLIKDKWWKVLLYCFLDALILVISIMVLVGLVILWGPFIFIAPLLAILVGEALSIIGAYFIHAFKKVKI